MAGYSFGSIVALDVLHPRIDAWLAVAPPLGMRSDDAASSHDTRPKRLLVPEHDQYSDPVATREKSAHWMNTSVQVVHMADHFLGGQLSEITDMAKAFVNGLGER
jgi:alpha/beta superfamily hydrolase